MAEIDDARKRFEGLKNQYWTSNLLRLLELFKFFSGYPYLTFNLMSFSVEHEKSCVEM